MKRRDREVQLSLDHTHPEGYLDGDEAYEDQQYPPVRPEAVTHVRGDEKHEHHKCNNVCDSSVDEMV